MIELHRRPTRARTPKTCTQCRGGIAPGETYNRWEISLDDAPQRYPVRMVECSECAGDQAEPEQSPAFEPAPRPVRVTPTNRAELAGTALRYISMTRTRVTHLAEVALGDGLWLAVEPLCRTVRSWEWHAEPEERLEAYAWLNTYNGEDSSAVTSHPGENLLERLGGVEADVCPRCASAFRRLYAEWRRAQSAEVREVGDLL